jgi:hypothetical protein
MNPAGTVGVHGLAPHRRRCPLRRVVPSNRRELGMIELPLNRALLGRARPVPS